jgi:transcriptional regulator with XRE-family HTH domain
MEIREKLREARKIAGLTQEELSERSGVSLRSISDYENLDDANITIGSLKKIATALNQKLSYFTGESGLDAFFENQKKLAARMDIGASVKPFSNVSIRDETEENGENLADSSNIIYVPRLIIRAAAGTGAHLEGINDFPTDGTIALDVRLFKTRPPTTIKAICVEGYSMIPMLMPDTWVVFDIGGEFRTDGLYVLNWRNELMVKLLQIDPKGRLHIKSTNKDYESWIVDPDDQSVFVVVGKVLKIVI